MTDRTFHDYISGHDLSELCSLTVIGSGQAEALLVTSRQIDDPAAYARRLTPERMRIADHLMHPAPFREMLIAHKTISEWLAQDERRAKPSARIEAKNLLEKVLAKAGIRPGTPGHHGGWLTSSMPTSEASDPEGTIRQALRAFSTMVGKRNIYVVGRENGNG